MAAIFDNSWISQDEQPHFTRRGFQPFQASAMALVAECHGEVENPKFFHRFSSH